MNPITVTFDTNAGNLVADPAQYSSYDQPPGTAERIRRAIQEGKIVAFVSEASVFVECLSFPDKLAYLAVAGRPGARPTPDPRRVAIFAELSRLGIRLLHAPLIAAEKFIDMPWAMDNRFSAQDRLERFSSFGRGYPRHEPLKAIGEASFKAKPLQQRKAGMPAGQVLRGALDWTLAPKRDWDEGDEAERKRLREKIGPMFGEWCDILIVASHYGYGNDYFCTTDRGKEAGSGSLLHHENRANLADQGIRIISPAELVQIIEACRAEGAPSKKD